MPFELQYDRYITSLQTVDIDNTRWKHFIISRNMDVLSVSEIVFSHSKVELNLIHHFELIKG